MLARPSSEGGIAKRPMLLRVAVTPAAPEPARLAPISPKEKGAVRAAEWPVPPPDVPSGFSPAGWPAGPRRGCRARRRPRRPSGSAARPARLPISSSISETDRTSRSIRASVSRSSSSRCSSSRRKARSSASRRIRRDLLVDDLGGVLGVVAGLAHLAAEERVLVGVAERDRADPVAHAPLGDHHPGEPGGLLEVVGGAGGQVVVDQPFGRPAAQEPRRAGPDLALADS